MPVWRPKAEEDLTGIVDYIAQDKPRAAVETGDMLIRKAKLLDRHPELGQPGRTPGTRELVVLLTLYLYLPAH